ncbi:hypothetical protein [Odoribacter lunatus]|uniref:hypothetical protein n=1 Tax=Odoribacter lunatus TaxID=2941335 RepID=UPI00203A8687|nr:hypothetical protein [Odoribacter lunatus]
MNRQRFAIFIVGIIGLVATFLPWYYVEMVGNLTGVFSSGWFTFIMFLLVLFLAIRRDMGKDVSKGTLWLMSLCGIVAGIVVLWRIMDIDFSQDTMMSLSGRMSGIMANEVSIRYGAWLVVIAGFCVPLTAIIFRNKRTALNERYD